MDLGVSPLPVDLWNVEVSGKLRSNLWRSITYGQNLLFKALSCLAEFLPLTILGNAILLFLMACAQGQMSHGLAVENFASALDLTDGLEAVSFGNKGTMFRSSTNQILSGKKRNIRFAESSLGNKGKDWELPIFSRFHFHKLF